MAIKVMDVEGDVLCPDAGRTSQDFLMINQPAFAFASVKDYLRLTQIIRANNDDVRPFFAPLQGATDGFSQEDLARIGATFQAVLKLRTVPGGFFSLDGVHPTCASPKFVVPEVAEVFGLEVQAPRRFPSLK